MNKLERAGIISLFCLAASGCATTKFTHPENPCSKGQGLSLMFGLLAVNDNKIDENCSEDQIIQMLIDAGDPGVQAVGVRTMIDKYGAESISEQVAETIKKATQPKDCEVEAVEDLGNGVKRIKLGNCVPASK